MIAAARRTPSAAWKRRLVVSACTTGGLIPIVAASAMLGCATDSPPLVAEVELLGTLESNTCGSGGFDADESIDEVGELHGYAGDDASFAWADSDSTIAGTSTEKGVYTFTTTTTTVAITDATGAAVCTIERRTKLTLTVSPPPTAPIDAGTASSDAALSEETSSDVAYVVTGTLTEDLYTASGTNCASLRGENGGAYETFPCRVTYSLEGGSI